MALSIPTQNAQQNDAEFKNLFRFASGLIAYTTITPVYYQGAIAGSEFETYNASKIYVALKIVASRPSLLAAGLSVDLYNEANALCLQLTNDALSYTGAAVNYFGNNAILTNVYFSRIVTANYTQMLFNGYRLNT